MSEMEADDLAVPVVNHGAKDVLVREKSVDVATIEVLDNEGNTAAKVFFN